MDIDFSIISDFETTAELDREVAGIMIAEFQKPGLILLPLGKTFEDGIYPLVNDHFATEKIRTQNLNDQEELLIAKDHKVHSNLRLSHLDELIDGNIVFAETLRTNLEAPIKQCGENFYPINVNDIDGFDRFIKAGSGPRVIFAGLGPDPGTAHIAFIGEDFINSSTTIVNLSTKAQESYACTTAVSIGTDIFRSGKLEQIIIVAKGADKAESIRAGFRDPDAGLGYLIKHHRDKLRIYADRAALR